MKTTVLSIIVGLLLTIFAFGCDRRKVDVPSEPNQVSSNDAKRVLTFSYVDSHSGKDFYNVSLYDTDYYEDSHDGTRNSIYDLVSVSIGDTLVPLLYHDNGYYGDGWWSDTGYSISGEQLITLNINNNAVLNSHIEAIHRASAAFPASYDYQQPLTLNWAVSTTNEYQFVIADTKYLIDGVYYFQNSAKRYAKQIPANQCSYTFPANCVPLKTGKYDRFAYLCVEEVNYKIVNKTAIMVYQEEGYLYNSGTVKNNGQRFQQRIMDIHRTLSK